MSELDLKPTTLEASQSEIPATEDIQEYEAYQPTLREYLIGTGLSLSIGAAIGGPILLGNHHVKSDIEALKVSPALSHSELVDSNVLLDQAFNGWVDIPYSAYLIDGATKYELMFNVELTLQCDNVNISPNWQSFDYSVLDETGQIAEDLEITTDVPFSDAHKVGDIVEVRFAVAPWEIRYNSNSASIIRPAEAPERFAEEVGQDGYLIWEAEPK